MKWKNFKRKEFACKCGCGTNLIKDDFIDMLQRARNHYGKALIINSGYRCPSHPESLKNPNFISQHTKGIAADIKCEDSVSSAKILDSLGWAGFRRLGIHSKFCHVDFGKGGDAATPVIWLYN